MATYCYRCGNQLSTKMLDGRTREFCPVCGWIHYEHRKVSAAAAIETDGKLMLVKRGIEPWKGCWYMPAGYLEVDEDPKKCAAREVFEETGFRVQIGKLIDIYTYEDDPRGNGIVLLYEGRISSGEVKENHETLEVGFFTPEECRHLPKSGSGGARQIEDWIARAKRSNT